MLNITSLASDEIIDWAYHWLCQKRKNHSHHNDVWHLRRNWKDIKPKLQAQLRQGKYRLRAQRRYRINGEIIDQWDAQDALVLKAVALLLQEILPKPVKKHCFHLAGTGGAKGTVRAVNHRLPDYQHVCRMDVKGYYANINHRCLWLMLRRKIKDKKILGLLR